MSTEKSELPLIIHLLKPLTAFVPSVKKPNREVIFKEKSYWTIITLLVFLVCCQIPLYGVKRVTTSDPFYWFRMVVASNRGTLMELGITPIVTSSMMVQFLVSSNLIKFNAGNKADRMLFESIQKLFAIFAIIFEAYIYVRSGIYGTAQEIGYGNIALIVCQLFLSSLVVLLLDEVLDNGYGLGSGISLFIATNFCENIFWSSFSPTTINTAKGMQFEGAVVEFLHVILTQKFTVSNFLNTLNRSSLPNIKNLTGTLVLVLLVVYLQELCYFMPLTKRNNQTTIGHIPVKIMSSSNVPIILQSALVSNINFVSQMLFKFYKNNTLVHLLGQWDYVDGRYKPTGGLAYYIRPIRSFTGIKDDPVHFLIYLSFVMVICALFSFVWLDVSGNSPIKIAQSLDKQGIVIKGKRRKDTLSELKKYLYSSAILGGMGIAGLTVFSDLIGAIGSGTGILLAVNLTSSYYKSYIEHNKRME